MKPFKAVVDGDYGHLPETASSMVGDIDEADEKGKKLAAEAASPYWPNRPSKAPAPFFRRPL